jgi:hypothetical protein
MALVAQADKFTVTVLNICSLCLSNVESPIIGFLVHAYKCVTETPLCYLRKTFRPGSRIALNGSYR